MNITSMLRQQITLNHASIADERDEFNNPVDELDATQWRGWLDTSGALRDSSEQVGQDNWTTSSRTLFLRPTYGGVDLVTEGLVSVVAGTRLYNVVGTVQDHTDPTTGRLEYFSVTVDRTT